MKRRVLSTNLSRTNLNRAAGGFLGMASTLVINTAAKFQCLRKMYPLAIYNSFGKSHFLIGKSSWIYKWVLVHSYVKSPKGILVKLICQWMIQRKTDGSWWIHVSCLWGSSSQVTHEPMRDGKEPKGKFINWYFWGPEFIVYSIDFGGVPGARLKQKPSLRICGKDVCWDGHPLPAASAAGVKTPRM